LYHIESVDLMLEVNGQTFTQNQPWYLYTYIFNSIMWAIVLSATQ